MTDLHQEIARLSEQGYSLSEVSRELGIGPRQVSRVRAKIRDVGYRSTDDPVEFDKDGWRARALCRNYDLNAFYPTPMDSNAKAAALMICGDCPVQMDCLDWALAVNDQEAVLGGMTVNERRRIRAERRQAEQGAA